MTKDHGRGGSRTANVIRLDALNPGGDAKAKLAGALDGLASAEPPARTQVRTQGGEVLESASGEGPRHGSQVSPPRPVLDRREALGDLDRLSVRRDPASRTRRGPGRERARELPRERRRGSCPPRGGWPATSSPCGPSLIRRRAPCPS
jgi:hypothetical protein